MFKTREDYNSYMREYMRKYRRQQSVFVKKGKEALKVPLDRRGKKLEVLEPLPPFQLGLPSRVHTEIKLTFTKNTMFSK